MAKSIQCEVNKGHKIEDGEEMALLKIPHRAPMSSCRKCAERMVEDGRGRIVSTPKVNVGGIISDPPWLP